LRKTFATAAAHLDPGSVFVVAPDYFRETFQGPRVDHGTHSDVGIELTHIEYAYDPDPDDSTMETIIFYFIREKGDLRIEQDRHVTGLFPKSTWIDLMKESGFLVEEWPCLCGDDPRQTCLLVGVPGESRCR
jgi:hypothetical protein